MTVIESMSKRVTTPSGLGIYVRATVRSSLTGKSTADTLPSEESTMVLISSREGLAVRVTLTVALELVDVRRTKDVPRRTRKSCGMMLSVAGEGPYVDVTEPLEAPARGRICLG